MKPGLLASLKCECGTNLGLYLRADRWWCGDCLWADDIAAAWKVVEKLWPRLASPVLIGGGLDTKDKAWCCEIGPHDSDGMPAVEAFAPTAPLAICRAALAAEEGGDA